MSNEVPTPRTWGSFWDYFGLKLVEFSKIQSASRILDIGCGSGTSLYPAVKRVGESGEVIGIDNREPTIKRVNSEIERCGIPNARVYLMDAKNMEFKNNEFDYVLGGMMGWGSCFNFERCEFTDTDHKMNEIVRVLKPEGGVGISSFVLNEETNPILKAIESFLPSNHHLCSEVATFGHTENEKGWRKILTSAGFNYISFKEVSYLTKWKSEGDWWKDRVNSGWSEILQTLENESIVTPDQIRSEAFKILAYYKKENEFIFEVKSLLSYGKIGVK